MCEILLCDVQNITTWVQGLLAWYFPDPRMRQTVCFVVGVRVVLGMVRPSSWIWRPNSSGIDLVSHGNVTTRGAYPSSWLGVGRWFCW